QRQNLIALGRLERNQLDDCRINFEVGEINSGNAVLTRQKVRHVLVGQKAELHQRRAEAAVGLLLDLACLCQLLRGYDLLFDEKITQPLRHTYDLLSIDKGKAPTARCPRKSACFQGETSQRFFALTEIVNADE